MFHIPSTEQLDTDSLYGDITSLIASVTSDEPNLIANLANSASVLFHMLPNVNWAGFYLLLDDELVLGPFHGKPACVRIAIGRGVCGTAAAERRTVVVPNVGEFPGHIACDSASMSEIVVPLMKDNRLIGVLDIDSPVQDRFSLVDAQHLERIVELLVSRSTA